MANANEAPDPELAAFIEEVSGLVDIAAIYAYLYPEFGGENMGVARSLAKKGEVWYRNMGEREPDLVLRARAFNAEAKKSIHAVWRSKQERTYSWD